MKDETDGDAEAVEATVETLRWARSGRYAPEDPNKLPHIIVLACNGWEEAHRVLCDYAGWLTSQQKPHPHSLQLYINWRASEGFKASRKRNLKRDAAILIAVRELVAAGYSKTRNDATTGKPSACSIVAEALSRLRVHMTETTVAQIIQRRGKEILEL